MAYILELLVFITLPVTLICGFFFWLGRRARSPKVGIWLQRLAVISWLWFLAVVAFMALAHSTCEPKFIFRYENCTLMPDALASSSFGVFVWSIWGAMIVGGAALLTFGISQWVLANRARNESPKP